MQVLKGIAVSPGIAIGQVFLLEAEGVRIPQHFIPDHQVAQEALRLEKALEEVQGQLEQLAEHLAQKAGSSVAEIFTAHAHMLRDEEFRRWLFDRIRQKKYTAEFAVSRTMRYWRGIFQEDPDSFLASRVADLDDLERRLLRRLLGEKREQLDSLHSEVILVAHDLGPSETATMDPEWVKGFAIDGGGPTSHTAIIAKAVGIPAVVALETATNELSGGDTIILDGTRGLVITEPSAETIRSYRRRQSEAIATDKVLLEELRDLPAETADGRRIKLLVNIDSPKEIARALDYGAEGVGLYRTEFLFLAADPAKGGPDEQEHFEAYVSAVRQLGERPIVIRTLDLGADKFVRDGTPPREKNPFLGLRSIRYCLEHPDLLRSQLRAILRASAFGNVKVMFPLVSTAEELAKAVQILNEIRAEFDASGQEYDRTLQVGVMIEVPSAAICADSLARQADFFSVGTNDLVQYTLAVDRANEHVASLYRPSHPAVLRLVRMTVEAANRAGIEVGMCGEMASEIMYTVLLVGLGIEQISVAPPMILPEVKKIIRTVKYEEAKKLAQAVLETEEPADAFETLQQCNRELLPMLFP